jgi:hypothetical protein
MRKIRHIGLVTALLLVSVAYVFAADVSPTLPTGTITVYPENKALVVGPEATFPAWLEIFPLMIDTSAFTSLLITSELVGVPRTIFFNSLPAGATTFIQRAIAFGALQTRFLTPDDLFLDNTTGQVQIFTQVQNLGQIGFDAMLVIIQQSTGFISIVSPLRFTATITTS